MDIQMDRLITIQNNTNHANDDSVLRPRLSLSINSNKMQWQLLQTSRANVSVFDSRVKQFSV